MGDGHAYTQGQLQPMTPEMLKAQREIQAAAQMRAEDGGISALHRYLGVYRPAVSLGDGVYHEGERMDDDGAVPIHDESGSVTVAVSMREMDLRNMRALLDQKNAQIDALRSDLSAALMAGAKVDEMLSRMADENRTLTQQVENLTRQIQGQTPAPKREPVPHNPWGKRHDGRAPDQGEPR